MESTAAAPVADRRPRLPRRLLAMRSDDRLVDLVRAGDDAAFEVLYRRHVAGILGFCRHMLGSHDDAEDAVQQVFASAHGALRRGGDREIAAKPWLYAIARNRCLSMLRARRELATEPAEPSTAGLADEVERRADLRELVGDLQRLPDHQRAALLLTELGDLSHAEAAAVLKMEPSSVKGLVFRARSALVDRRDARAADCEHVREQLATASGGTFRRSSLRYHLDDCPECSAYLEEVRRQRKLLGLALPVVPSAALHDSVMAAAGIGGTSAAGAAGAGLVGGAGTGVAGGVSAGAGAAAGASAAVGGVGSSLLGLGSSAVGGTLAKVAIVGALAGGAAVTTDAVLDDGRSGSRAPADVSPAPTDVAPAPAEGAGGIGAGFSSRPDTGTPRAQERSEGRHRAERRARGWQRARDRSRGRAGAGGQSTDRRKGAPPSRAIGRDGQPPGRAVGRDGRPPASSSPPPSPPSRPAPAAGRPAPAGPVQARPSPPTPPAPRSGDVAPQAPASVGRPAPPPQAAPPAHGKPVR